LVLPILLLALLPITPVLATPIYPQQGYNAQKQGLAPYKGSDSPNIKWTASLGSCTFQIAQPVVGEDGTIYIACAVSILGPDYSINREVHLLIIDPDTGAIKRNISFGNMGGRDIVNPVLLDDGTLVLPITSANMFLSNVVLLVDKDGVIKHNWTYAGGYYYYGVLVNQGKVILDVGESTVQLLNVTTGSLTVIANYYEPALVGADGAIYAFDWGNYKTVALNPDGTLKWSYPYGFPLVIGKDGTVYTYNDVDKKMYAINPDGTVKWSKSIPWPASVWNYFVWAPSVALGPDGTIYSLSVDDSAKKSFLMAIDPSNGNIKWEYLVSNDTGAITGSIPVVDKDGTIYFFSLQTYVGTAPRSYRGNGEIFSFMYSLFSTLLSYIARGGTNPLYQTVDQPSYLYAINPDGTLKWKLKNPYGTDFGSDPRCYLIQPVVSSHSLIIVDRDGHVYSIGTETQPPSTETQPPTPTTKKKPPVSIILPSSPILVSTDYLLLAVAGLAVVVIALSLRKRP